ncbi:UNVERIFIED_CONTAM: hypothetical protein FKN15_045967 [Acipenser sinensis]
MEDAFFQPTFFMGYGNSSWVRQECNVAHALRSHVCRKGLTPPSPLLQLPSPAHLAIQVQQQLRQVRIQTQGDISPVSVDASTRAASIYANFKGLLQPLVDLMSTINARLDALEKRPAAAAAPPVPSTSSTI